jgi:hypothetical protein
MNARFPRLLASLATLLALAACTTTTGYRPEYIAAARLPTTVHSDGRVLIVTRAADDAYVYTGHPTSFSGRATSLTLPLGTIVREAAVAAFTETFPGGVDVGGAISEPARYVVIVAPRLVDFRYAFDQLRHYGLAATPTAEVSAEIRVLDARGATRWHRSYSSGLREGPPSVLTAPPGEEINKLAHRALYELFRRAALDVVHEVLTVPANAAG